MKITDLINDFNSRKIMNTKNAPNAIQEYLAKKLEFETYVSFADKRELCENVLNVCNSRDINSGLIKVDSITRYIIFTISIISKYTNLEFSSGEDEELDSLDEYDMLCKNHLLNPIIEMIGEEYATCNNMLNMMMDDILANNNTVEAVIGHAFNKVTNSLDGLIDAFAEKVEDMELDLSQIDIDKYKGLLYLLPQK